MTDESRIEAVNWLVTGGCGFIGTSLIRNLLEQKLAGNIRVLDNLSVGGREDLSGVCRFATLGPEEITGAPCGVELVQSDVRAAESCDAACRGVDVVVHLAANTGVGPSVENPRQDMEVNVTGTFNMLEAARHHGVAKFIFASSGAPLGAVEPPIHEELAARPISPYGASKLAGEGYCSAYYRSFGLRTVALRFGNVYGRLSKHKNSVVAKFIKQALRGEELEIFGDGSQTRDFIYIDDLVQAILLSVQADVGGEVFQIAMHRETSVNEVGHLIKTLVEATGRPVMIRHGSPRTGDAQRNYSDTSKARRMLGYDPRFDLERGLRATIEYFLLAEAQSVASSPIPKRR